MSDLKRLTGLGRSELIAELLEFHAFLADCRDVAEAFDTWKGRQIDDTFRAAYPTISHVTRQLDEVLKQQRIFKRPLPPFFYKLMNRKKELENE